MADRSFEDKLIDSESIEPKLDAEVFDYLPMPEMPPIVYSAGVLNFS